MIVDLFSRRVVGWKLGQTLESELVVTALRNALVLRQPQAGLYFHSDRGVLLQTELENRELGLNYSRPERTSLDERY